MVERAAGDDGRRVVVGIDGSRSSLSALRWAAGVARATGRTLTVAHAWLPTLRPRVEPDLEREIAAATAARMVASALAEIIGEENAWVTTVLRCGDPVAVLSDVADGADLLVVGTSGHGHVTGALLGSVAMRLAGHATAPVAVVPLTGNAAASATKRGA